MKKNYFIKFLILGFLLVPITIKSSFAQIPGDACTAGEVDVFRRVVGPQIAGIGYFLVCDGSAWQDIMVFSTSGGDVMFNSSGLAAAPVHIDGEAIILESGLACSATTEGAIRYNSTGTLHEYCDGSSWSSIGGSGGFSAINDLSDAIYDGSSLFLGNGAGANDDGSNENVAVGLSALYANTLGIDNTAIGYYALTKNTSGTRNVATGNKALWSNTSGARNVATGTRALYKNTSGNDNSAHGGWSLYENTIGDFNVAIGHNALYTNVAKSKNTAVGDGAMYLADNAAIAADTFNTALGHQALYGSATQANNTGVQNTALGSQTLLNNESGSNNVAIGYLAGDLNTTGSDNILIGYNVDAPAATASNQLNIGNLLYGDMASGRVGVGNANPQTALDVTGSMYHTGIIVDLSDRRMKNNIRLIPSQIAEIKRLKPVSFTMKDDPENTTELGLIAQDVEKIYPELVMTLPNGTKALNYIGLISPLIKATQDQQEIIEELQEANKELVRRLDKLEKKKPKTKYQYNQ